MMLQRQTLKQTEEVVSLKRKQQQEESPWAFCLVLISYPDTCRPQHRPQQNIHTDNILHFHSDLGSLLESCQVGSHLIFRSRDPMRCCGGEEGGG